MGVAEPQAASSPVPAAAPGPSPQATGAPPAAATPAVSPPAASDGSEPGRDPHRTRRVLGWASLAVGAEAAVIAIVTSFMIEHQKGIRDDGCNAQKVCTSTGLDAVGTIHTLIPVNTTSWFVAAAGLGAGAVLLFTSRPESEPHTAITLSPNSSGVGVGVRSTF